MLGTSDGTFCPLSKLWCKSPQTNFLDLNANVFCTKSSLGIPKPFRRLQGGGMYIRETLTRRTANNTYRSVRLVEGRRVGRKVQQKTLLNLGTGFSIPKAQWPELVEIIESKLAGNEYLFQPAPELAAAAESIVQRLRSREFEKPTDESLDGDTAHIKLNSVEMDNGRSAGSERLALGALDALGLPGVLKDVGFSARLCTKFAHVHVQKISFVAISSRASSRGKMIPPKSPTSFQCPR